VFVYTVGTGETFTDTWATTVINDMAAMGFVAASVNYAETQFGNCSQLSAKASCIYTSSSSGSALSQLCARAKADCSKGIVVGGISQGAVLATLANNFNSGVRAAYGMGLSDHYANFNLASCIDPSNRTLPSTKLRAVDGQEDQFAGSTSGFQTGTQAMVQTSLTNVLGVSCAANSVDCLTSNGSGWIIVENSQVQDGAADHCYPLVGGCTAGNPEKLDSGWSGGTTNWELSANLEWLASFTSK
jgi:hypothetical protein